MKQPLEATRQVAVILDYLKDIAANNDRTWFWANRERYDNVMSIFQSIVAQLILRIRDFDPSVRHLQVKDCTYRFFRDVRFSQDKSPYKRHLGAYVCAKGKKSLHGGYYLHFEPGNCMFAGGCYMLMTPMLNVLRQKIVGQSAAFSAIVDHPEFKELYPVLTDDPLKVMPRGLPRDFFRPEWLKCRNYLVCSSLDDEFFQQTRWMDEIARRARLIFPFNEFLNEIVDDYI